jgi:tetratricopeptide (TPR) repeat protein
MRSLLIASAWVLAPSPGNAQNTHDHAQPAPLLTVGDWAQGAQLFDGLGRFHRPVSTSSPEAQLYFDQGMRLIWAFNHDEATRSFARAAQLDPQCALCFWGVALTLGPNYNMPMMAKARAAVGWEALGKAQANAGRATPVERALISALAARFAGPEPLDPGNSAPRLSAYVEAMRGVARQFPQDNDVQTLFAEALMNTNPWKLWNPDGSPGNGTPEIVATLQSVLAADPHHPGANHYLIHAVEASKNPEVALPSAEALKDMMPAAGHLVHMPSHIMQRVGRYEEAAQANRLGAAADLAYLKRTAPPDYYPMYLVHNFQFLAFAAAMEGRSEETISATRSARAAMPDAMLFSMPGLDWSLGYLYDAMIRFGRWDEMLRETAPDSRLVGLSVSYHQARAIALAATGRPTEAASELAASQALMGTVQSGATQGMNAAQAVYEIGQRKAAARLAAAKGDADTAISLLEEASALEDKLAYNEPEDVFFPARHLLGAALLDAGRGSEAEAVFREDLKRHPKHGWALTGLKSALAAQKRSDEIGSIDLQLRDAWANADRKIERAAF